MTSVLTEFTCHHSRRKSQSCLVYVVSRCGQYYPNEKSGMWMCLGGRAV